MWTTEEMRRRTRWGLEWDLDMHTCTLASVLGDGRMCGQVVKTNSTRQWFQAMAPGNGSRQRLKTND